MYSIENEFLKVGVLQKGAELRSMVDKRTGFEWIWQADERFWGKSSPVLFPIVGALKDDRFVYKNHSYRMARHGFARDNDFILIEQSSSKLVFELVPDQEMKSSYPFDFSLVITYQVLENKLDVSYLVQNRGNEKMYFSLGGHPAFNFPTDNPSTDRVYIEFPKDNTLDRYFLFNNLLSTSYKDEVLNSNRLFLESNTFKDDAWIMKKIRSEEIYLKSDNSDRKLGFISKGFPFFGIWSAPGGAFVCLEPWAGLPDSEQHNYELSDKEGILALYPHKDWLAKWIVNV